MKRTREIIKQSFGFTLIEILVAMAVIGILSTLSLVILINTIRNSNKANITNEAKENLTLVSEYFDRDVRTAATVTSSGSTSITLSYNTGASVIWTCVSQGAGSNNYLRREVDNPAPLTDWSLPITNKNPTEGVSFPPSGCAFTVSAGASSERIVTLDLTLQEGKGISGGPQELGVNVNQKITAFTRGY